MSKRIAVALLVLVVGLSFVVVSGRAADLNTKVIIRGPTSMVWWVNVFYLDGKYCDPEGWRQDPDYTDISFEYPAEFFAGVDPNAWPKGGLIFLEFKGRAGEHLGSTYVLIPPAGGVVEVEFVPHQDARRIPYGWVLCAILSVKDTIGVYDWVYVSAPPDPPEAWASLAGVGELTIAWMNSTQFWFINTAL